MKALPFDTPPTLPQPPLSPLAALATLGVPDTVTATPSRPLPLPLPLLASANAVDVIANVAIVAVIKIVFIIFSIVWSGPEVAELRRVGENTATADDGGGAMDGASTFTDTVSGEQRVHFDAGESGTAKSGTLQPGTSVRYILGANNEQFLNVDVGSHGGALNYEIFNPDGTLLLDLISADLPYRGQLWQSGDHVVEVVNAGAQPVTFDIGIGID